MLIAARRDMEFSAMLLPLPWTLLEDRHPSTLLNSLREDAKNGV